MRAPRGLLGLQLLLLLLRAPQTAGRAKGRPSEGEGGSSWRDWKAPWSAASMLCEV